MKKVNSYKKIDYYCDICFEPQVISCDGCGKCFCDKHKDKVHIWELKYGGEGSFVSALLSFRMNRVVLCDDCLKSKDDISRRLTNAVNILRDIDILLKPLYDKAKNADSIIEKHRNIISDKSYKENKKLLEENK